MRTAARLFAKQGYGQTGVNQIMKDAGATSGSFYHFFPAKEDLLLAVLDTAGEDLEIEVFEKAIAVTADPVERVLAVIEAWRSLLIEHDFALGSPIGTLAAELSDSHPHIRQRTAELYERMVSRVQQWLVDAGEALSQDIDRRNLAMHVVAVMEGAIVVARACRDLAIFDAAMTSLCWQLQATTGREVPASQSLRPRAVKVGEQPPRDWKSW